MEQASGPRVGLALSSGGARGFAHVGVIKALREAGLTIARVAGSSMGSIVGAGYAVSADVDQLERWVLDFRARDHTRRGLPVMDRARITDFLDTILGGAHFADCAVPLTVVATDLKARVSAALTDGPVALATFASMAMPFLHRPVLWEGRLLAEGSLSCVLPLTQADGEDVDIVIGSQASREWKRFDGLMQNLSRSVGHAINGWGRPYVEFFRQCAPLPTLPALPTRPTIVLSPRLERVSTIDFSKAREAIAAGEEAVVSRIDEIKRALGLA